MSWLAQTYGFVGADLAALTREAALEAVRRIMPRLNLADETIPDEVLDALSVEPQDFDNALKRVQPSAMREVMVETPSIGWDDVGGLDAARDRLREGVELPLKHPEAFRRLGIRPAKGFLLYGPPGTGKTLLAKATARESQANFIATKSSDLLSKWYGESEQQIARLFARARQVAPTIIFIDELDSLVPARGGGLGEPQVTERVVNTILAEMDGLEELNNVVVIGATNRPNLIDPALLRPGPSRRADLCRHARHGRTTAHPRHPYRRTCRWPRTSTSNRSPSGPSGSPAPTSRTSSAAPVSPRFAAALDANKVTMADFEAALGETRASVTPEMLEEYERIQKTLKSDAVRPPAALASCCRACCGSRGGEGKGRTLELGQSPRPTAPGRPAARQMQRTAGSGPGRRAPSRPPARRPS